MNTSIALDEASKALTEARGETVTRRDVENGLIAVLGLDQIYATFSTATSTVHQRSAPRKALRVSRLESILTVGFPLLLIEAEVRFKGEVWSVHKTDADPLSLKPAFPQL